jgi:hypothetical protein
VNRPSTPLGKPVAMPPVQAGDPVVRSKKPETPAAPPAATKGTAKSKPAGPMPLGRPVTPDTTTTPR